MTSRRCAKAHFATSGLAQSAASLVVPIENEPAPRLFVEPPLPGPLRVLTAQTVTFKSPGK